MKYQDNLEKVNNFEEYRRIRSKLLWGKRLENPIISIVIPTCGRIDTIRLSIESAIQQNTDIEFEVIILDNSINKSLSESLLNIVKELNNEKIMLFKNEEQLPVFANWNRCVEKAYGSYVCMIHDDDFISINHLSTMMENLKKYENAKFISCNLFTLKNEDVDNYVKENGFNIKNTNINQLSKLSLDDFVYYFNANLLGAIFEKKAFIDLGGFRVGESMSEDYHFVIRFSYYYDCYLLNSYLYFYRWGIGSSIDKTMWERILVDDYIVSVQVMDILKYRYIKRLRRKLVLMKEIKNKKYNEEYSEGVLNINSVLKKCNINKMCLIFFPVVYIYSVIKRRRDFI